MDFEGLLATLPPAEFAFAYGSGVFEQKGYETQKDPPMIDLVVAVADPVAWHEENLRRNRSHYTFLGSFGGAAIARMQEDFGAGLYYNTLIPIPEGVRGFKADQKMKYGVMSSSALIDDLLNWRSMYVSGRMHKPVRIVVCSSTSILAASRENLRHALRTALLLLPASFTAEQLFVTIAALSYTGDFRMVFGEHPDKVRNIVTKSLPLFYALYMPVIKANFPTVTPAPPPITNSGAAGAGGEASEGSAAGLGSGSSSSSSGSGSGSSSANSSGGGSSGYVSADGTCEHPLAFRQDTSPEARLALGMALPYHLQKRMAASFFASLQRRGMHQLQEDGSTAVTAATSSAASSAAAAGGGHAVGGADDDAGSGRIAAARRRWAQVAFLRRRIGSTLGFGAANGSAGNSSAGTPAVSWRSPVSALRQSQQRAANAAAAYGTTRLGQQLLRARALVMASTGREMMQRARVQRLQWIVSRQLKREARATAASAGSPSAVAASSSGSATAATGDAAAAQAAPLSLTKSLRQHALRILEQRRAKLAARLSGHKPQEQAQAATPPSAAAAPAQTVMQQPPLNLAGELPTDAEGQRAEELRNLLEADGEAAQLSFARAARDAQIVSFWEAMLGDSISLRDRQPVLGNVEGLVSSSAVSSSARTGSLNSSSVRGLKLRPAPSPSAAATAVAAAGLFSRTSAAATRELADPSADTLLVRPAPSVDIASRVRVHLRPALAHIVGASARSQSLKGVITAGPVKAAIYAAAKVKKYLGALASKR